MNASQRRLLVWGLVVAAVWLHLASGRWEASMPIDMEVNLFDVDGMRSFGWNGPGNHALLKGVVAPLVLLAAAAFFWLARRPTSARLPRS